MCARSIFELFLVSHAMGGKQLVILVICMLGILFDAILTSKYLEIALIFGDQMKKSIEFTKIY